MSIADMGPHRSMVSPPTLAGVGGVPTRTSRAQVLNEARKIRGLAQKLARGSRKPGSCLGCQRTGLPSYDRPGPSQETLARHLLPTCYL